jgi:hypothetical protein
MGMSDYRRVGVRGCHVPCVGYALLLTRAPHASDTYKAPFLMDPVLPDPSAYEMVEVLKMALKEDEVEKLMEQLEDAVVGPQQVLELVQK